MRATAIIILLVFLLSACGNGIQPETQIAVVTTLAPQTSQPLLPSPTVTIIPTGVPTATLMPYTTPVWFQDALLYEIYVRSFADSDKDGIGDLIGVKDHLDYLKTLGVDTIWLMPIHPSPSQHGYDVEDFMAVNQDYGTLADFQLLVEEAHHHGIKVLLDFVPSHLSNRHPFFIDAFGNPQSIYSDWFVWTNDYHTSYAGFAGSEAMPRFNHYNPEVVNYLIQSALFWLDLDNDGDFLDGVDGFRVDNATYPPHEFFIALRNAIKSANPEALLLGEAWVHNPSDLNLFFTDQFDALFDFPFYELMQGNQNFNRDGLLAGKGFPVLLSSLLEEEAKKFPSEAMAVRFMNNHDTNRIATEVEADSNRQRLAAALLASLPGPVMLYYGEEIGMLGQKGGPPAWDNYRREPMDWYADQMGSSQTTWFQPEDRLNVPDDGISFEEQDTDPASLLNYYRKVFQMRQTLDALRSGNFDFLDLEVSASGPWGFIRNTDDHWLVVVFNLALEERLATITQFPFSASSLVDLLTGQEFPATKTSQPYQLTLPPASALWLSKK